MMDQELSLTYKRKQTRKTLLIIGSIVLILSIAYYGFYSVIKPTVKRSSLETALVELGSIQATIPASGIIVPEFEQLITSPIQARIAEVLHNTGEEVQPGEPILKLDKEYSLLAMDKLKEEQELNKNKIRQLKLSLQKNLDDLHTQIQIKGLKIKSLEATLADEIALKKIGGSTAENVEQAGMNLQICRLEAAQLQKQINNQKEAMAADLQALGLQINIQEKNIQELQSRLAEADIRATRKGVITWINDKIGSNINAGSELVRMADIRSFKVEGTVSESYANHVKGGTDVLVRINGNDLPGQVATVNPAVENGTVKFVVTLADKASTLLRPHLKVEVFIVTSFKEKTIRVKNGATFDGSVEQEIFVINTDKAIRRKVSVGESNVDFVEITKGLRPGEEIITTDMTQYKHLDSFTID